MITTVAGITSAISAGQQFKTSWNKTFPANGVAGFWFNTFCMGGQPAAGGYSGSTLAFNQMFGSFNASYPPWAPTTGRIYCGENVTPLLKHLVNLEIVSSTTSAAPGWLVLVDLLVNYPGIQMNTWITPQSFNNTINLGGNSWNGYVLPRYTNGVGVQMFIEPYPAALGASGTTIQSLSYTNTLGNASSIPAAAYVTNIAIPASVPLYTIAHSGLAQNEFSPFLPLAGGDQGIQSVSSIQLTAGMGASTAALILCKPLATIPLITSVTATNVTATVKDFIFNMPTFPRIYDGACLAFLYYSSGAPTTPAFYGTLDLVWG